ncbi:MAG: hypothetical protein M1822_008991 [Bathelium mastoideum]|nr:MAG: hypothetical protein M1822_008991 [Bathelium mastoideum]
MKTFALLSTLLTTALATPVPDLLDVSASASTSQHSQCPKNGNLPAGALSPSLIVPIARKFPNVAFGPTHDPKITPNDFCTIFNLEIPATAVNKTCTLEFLFPDHHQTSAWYVFDGPGDFVFNGYAYGAGAYPNTTYATQPAAGPSPPPGKLLPGNAYVLNSGSCGVQPGQTVPTTVSGALCSNDTLLEYEQTKDKGCPVGFYVVIS